MDETWELTAADEASLCGVEHCMIRMCGKRLVDRVLIDILCDSVGVVVEIEDIIQSRLQWYSHVMHRDINSQICEVTKQLGKVIRANQGNLGKSA